MNNIYTFILVFFIVSYSNSNKKTVSPKEYLEEVFNIIEEHSINRDSVDFLEIKRTAYAKLEDVDLILESILNVHSIEICYPIIESILKELKDNHSFFMRKEEVTRWKSTSKINGNNGLITFSCKRLNQDIGYINMKGFSSGDSIFIQNYADSLQHQIKLIDNEHIKGWILDLRENRGGNCWPMLAGIGPLLGNGICGYFIDNNQKKSSWFYQDGASGTDSLTITRVSKQPYTLINDLNPIAVLTGDQTASSGEVIVTAFHGKKNARSFGQSTWGVSTGNANFTLSDGSMLFLASSIYADRKERAFGKKIEPDEMINFSYREIGKPNDAVIKRAKEWIFEN